MSETPAPIRLTSQARSALRGAAHSLRPVVLIGDQGLTPAVIKEIEVALAAHELIKIRAGTAERTERDQMLEQLCAELGCAPVHHLGKTLIVYRPGKKGLYAEAAGIAPPIASTPKRKANEPHTPKRQAALGKKAVKPRKKALGGDETGKQTAGQTTKPARGSLKAFSAERTASGKRPASAGKARAGQRSPSKTPSRSALSLRAGARRVASRTSKK